MKTFTGSIAKQKHRMIYRETLPECNPLHCVREHRDVPREKEEYEIWHPFGRSFCEVCYYKRDKNEKC